MVLKLTTAAIAAAFVVAPGAAAAGPPNDARANAGLLGEPPLTVTATTTGATTEPSDPSVCTSTDGTLWYRLSATGAQRLVLRFTAEGNLDAAVAVYRLVRSRLSFVACAVADAKGKAALSFNTETDATYLIVVARATGSEDAAFQFKLFRPETSSRPPGRALPRMGVRSTVDPLVDFDDAWSVRMAPGVSYRINLAPAQGACVTAALYPPRIRNFADARPIHTLSCGGYITYTPGAAGGGVYSVLVRATGTRAAAERYRLTAGRAGADDMAPGIPLANLQTRRGSLSGRGLDVVDLYRFDVDKRSDVALRLHATRSASFDLLLVGETGRRLGCECGVTEGRLMTRLPAGHYFVAVRARHFSQGRYAVSLLVRTITATRLTFEGTAAPGRAVSLVATVAPAASGRVIVRVERFDPLMGWVFYRRAQLRLAGTGSATISFVPPTIGRWRARASYLGTRTSSPSESGFTTIVVR
jgi:hypothetical protein